MTNVLHSFIYGWQAGARLWPVVAVVWLVDSAIAGAMAAPVASQIAAVFGHSTLAPELAGPITLDWLLELPQGAELSGFPWLLFLLAPLVSTLMTTFLRGGMLGALARDRATHFVWKEFFGDCVRYFWRFLVILLLIVPAFLLVVAASLATLRVGFGPGGGLDLDPAITRGILVALLLFLLPTILDYTRISLVLDPDHSIFRHAGRSLRFVVIRFPAVLVIGLGFWVSAIVISALWPVVLALSSFQMGFLGAFLLQQLSVVLASWQRVAMLGGEMNLFAELSHKEGRGG